ncbi:NAD(P)-dependent dehydrogenase (short-subunit alcohol dehydrogenase family) [Hymenobacter luteus]|uniref:NAD(P)-dependent dehydrogenase (Short-subunit alcohol dehydrogenase family) n=2 Tax=Hymenobacter TaxID=89966 RepID=A0A7W9T2N1_9BACT|nr:MULTISPECIES: SDR family NAD(P)-dependent oxidoreductase [Hymenobacter]MBB4601721.1 NAD(P)-dependent dehydrogenase (short-subunit alcohol dehydrogenase family) [Hymenobacter latericoloratus]MBB6059850.1 NAD(P)-dependent dehydrogenase (short-subunit alcohol dehydrogenase family) [Hymenobacter luteus]
MISSLPLSGKTALVTGATSGIGLVTARELARQGARVVLVGRDPDKAARALAAVQLAVGPEAPVAVKCYDLSLLRNVRALARELENELSQLDILINNAGIMPGRFALTEEGHELSWATNHLAPYALTNLLLPLLDAAGQARVVTVASVAHWVGEIEPDRNVRNSPDKYSWLTAYADSKLANILFTNELAHRLDLTGITANCLHPGLVDTGLMRPGTSPVMKALWWAARPLMISPERGALTTLYLATSPEVARVSGRYFAGARPARTSERAQSRTEASRLWRISAEETGIE